MKKIKLTDICNPKQWKTIPTSDLLEEGFPVYGANGIIGYYKEYNHENPVIAITCRGATCGSINITVPKAYVTGNAMCLDDLQQDVDFKYLYYCLLHYNFATIISGSAQPQITRQGLEKVIISIGTPEEQKKIVAVLEKLHALIAARKQQLAALDELVKARFVEMFDKGDFPMKPVDELCLEIVDCPHTTPKYEGELKNPAIRTSEIKKGYITWDTMKYVSDDEYKERIARLRPEKGDIVYGREGTFGNAAILPAGYNFCLGQRVMLLRPDYSKCTSEYLLHAIISDDVYRQAVGKNNASTVAHVNVKDVKQFRIPFPPIALQKEYAAFVAQINKTKEVVKKSLEKSQLLFDSLMQEYFG